MRWMFVGLLLAAACSKKQEAAPQRPTCTEASSKLVGSAAKGYWCEKVLEGGRFLTTRTDGTKWVEGGMVGRDRHGTWTWYAADGKVAAVREYLRGELVSENVTDPAVKTPGE